MPLTLIIKTFINYIRPSVSKIFKEIIILVSLEKHTKTNRSFLNSYKNVLISISISCLVTGCGSNNKTNSTKTKVSRSAVNIESLKSHMAMRQYFTQLIKSDALTNPYYGSSSVKRYEAALKLAQKDENLEAMASLMARLGLALVDYGNIDEGIEKLKQAYKIYDTPRFPKNTIGELAYAMGVAYMRMGETDNCCANNVADSCIIPFSETAIHTEKQGSETAIKFFKQSINTEGVLPVTKYRSMWLMNLAFMTLGEYPEKVPADYLIPESVFKSEVSFPKFQNVALELGVATDSLAGGVVTEDMDGDGDLDLIVSSWEKSDSLRYYENRGKEGFKDKTKELRLHEVAGGLNLTPADYDNDGDLDIYVSRGAWLWEQGKIPDSLLQRQDDGTYLDVTYAVGLGRENYPSQAAAWADYDNDGDLDLYVGNEHSSNNNSVSERNGQVKGIVAPSKLFKNNGNGTFVDVTSEAGVSNNRFCKGCVWGDLNNDRWPDIVVSNLSGPNRLYINNKDGTFTDWADQAGVIEPFNSFPVWVWDFNNDGIEDIFIAGYTGSTSSYMSHAIGERVKNSPETFGHFIGKGDLKFVNNASNHGLDGPVLTMGANFGDLNNDGFLDFYLGTGQPDIAELVPNQMFLNNGGMKVNDITMTIGMGHLQKGHAISFADFDNDGDQDVFQQMGGAKKVDKFRDALYANPGFNNNWIKIRLEGVQSNRSAIGAKIKITLDQGNQHIYRSINTGGSFGANSLQQHIGIGSTNIIDQVEIFWPTSNTRQTFKNVRPNQSIQIREGEKSYKTNDEPLFSYDVYLED